MGTKLFTVPSFSPFMFYHPESDKTYQVGRIIFYNPQTGWKHMTPRGWISEPGRNDNLIKELELKQNIIKRAKEKLDGKLFFIRNTRLNQFFNDKSLYVDLYIPMREMNFLYDVIEIREGYILRKIPQLTSLDYPGILILDYDAETKEESEELKHRAIDLILQIEALETQLKDLTEELAKIDPKNSIRNNLKEVRAKMNGSK